jgi:L-iditol 2-dehydrogenase
MNIPSTMRAAVLYDWNEIRVEDRPVPRPGPEEVLIQVEACSICAGDVKIISRGMPKQPPMGEFIIGHEYAGVIIEKGETVDEFELGDRVTVEVHKGCGRCRNCLEGKYTACLNYGDTSKGHRANGFTTNGGFAEYAVNHVNTICKIPEGISFDEATVITTAGTSLYGIDKAGGFVPGDAVAVIGPGPIGLMAVQSAKAIGAENVILVGTRKNRLDLGKKLGADHVINVKDDSDPVGTMKKLTGGVGPDVVLVAAGNETALQHAIEMCRKGGAIVLLAHFDEPVLVHIGKAVINLIDIFVVRGEGRRSVHKALSLVEQGKIDCKPIITHEFPLEEISEGFDTFIQRKGDAIKVVIHP